jgi:hypothetical protein
VEKWLEKNLGLDVTESITRLICAEGEQAAAKKEPIMLFLSIICGNF